MAIRNAPAIDWPQLQRVLIHPRVEELMSYCKAVCQVIDGSDAAIQFCRVILNRPRLEWNPAPLITGNDLARMGIPAGPAYRELLTAVRDAQLKGELPDQASALAFVQSQWKGGLSKS